MEAIQHYSKWYWPYLGRGVYLFVLATTRRKYVGYYVGKSDDIGKRWTEHVRDWFGNPDDCYSIPESADAFLEDPVAVFNQRGLSKGRPDTREQRQETVEKMLASTWFCWAEVTCQPEHRIEDVEYALQEGLKKRAGIKVDEEIGDARNRPRPTSVFTIHNHFGREFLVPVLPATIIFTVNGGAQI